MKKILNTEKIIKLLKDSGYEYIDGEYKNQSSKFHFKDNDGYFYYRSLNNFIRRDSKCFEKFHRTNPYTIQNIKTYLKNIKTETHLVSTEFMGSSEKMEWICGDCGEIFLRSWNHMQHDYSLCLCDKCTHKEIGLKTRYKKEEIINILKQYKWMFYGDFEYENNMQNFTIINTKGFKAITTLSNFMSANGNIDIINNRNPYTIDNLNIILKHTPFKIISKEYNGNNEDLLWMCNDCGEIFKRKWNTYQQQKACLCPICSLKSKSYISYCVKAWLDFNNISYEMEKRFSNCRNKRTLPFDYYIEDKNILIEVDGKQHFQPVTFGYKEKGKTREPSERFIQVQKNDNIKNNFAKENNIDLIRIPYWEFKNKTYINKLNKLL